ncbi:hypothetical protein Pelo_16353 [Pelomyxa schiedti]|nr:hypothetical protein Pelo_16353 [Pelomyxa schiedti]
MATSSRSDEGVVVVADVTATSIVGQIDDIPTLAALDGVSRVFHSLASVKLRKILHDMVDKGMIWCPQQGRKKASGSRGGRNSAYLVGSSSVGKTSLIDMISRDIFSDDYVPTTTYQCKRVCYTIGRACDAWKYLWDIPENTDLRSPNLFSDCRVVVHVFSISDPKSLEVLKIQVQKVRAVTERCTKVVICGNKSDSPERAVPQWQALNVVKQCHADGYIETSAKTRKNLLELWQAIKHACDEEPPSTTTAKSSSSPPCSTM